VKEREPTKEELEIGKQGIAIAAGYIPAYFARSIGILLLGISAILLVIHFIGWI
jgi:hypothetical protein